METIKYGLIGKEDLKRGRSSFETTLADGRVVQLEEINLDSFDRRLSVDDAKNDGITEVLELRHTTTGTPAAGIGTRLLFSAESADENPSNLAAIEGALDDITAGSEDSTFYILLRRAGAALSRAFGFRNTGNFSLLFSAVLTAARTLTIPDATTTMVGTDVTQTLSGKTLTDSLHNAGAGSETFRPSGVIDSNTTAGATGANTNETDLITFTLPANSLNVNGKGVEIIAAGQTANNANTKTIRLYFGGTVIISNDVTTAPNNAGWVLKATVLRTAATTQKAVGEGTVGAALQTTNYTGVGETLTGSLVIKVSGQNGTAAANEITAQFMQVRFLN